MERLRADGIWGMPAIIQYRIMCLATFCPKTCMLKYAEL